MEDFNLPSTERVALLERLQETFGNVTPHFWAACQICDLSALEQLLHEPPRVIEGALFVTSQMVRHWGPSPRYQSRPSTPRTPTPQKSTASNSGLSPSTLPPPQISTAPNSGQSPSTLPPPPKRQKTLDSPTPLPRDVNTKKRAEERDNFCCVLTGIEMIEVAHIYPHHSMRQKEDKGEPRHIFWNHLRMFWPEEKVTAWEVKLFPQGIHEKGHEEVYNLISLAHQVHACWGRGLFALKPISESDDKKILKVQFFWQEKQQGSLPRMSFTTLPISTQGLEQTTGAHGGHIWLFDKNGKKIRSGDFFELRTDNPVQKPLPSFELLELQWFLQRIQGMAGAVDVGWEDWLGIGSESDLDNASEGVPGLDDDIEDFSLLSEKCLSSPAKPNYVLHPKHVSIAEVEGDRDREGERV
ncbi:hypothetical protein B0O99DRAFT_595842 [Bisporella sp. PMI_857]|nr:hypothetical protein B0O99DRAFT_595842 [Bisporella sp. PMI_857]